MVGYPSSGREGTDPGYQKKRVMSYFDEIPRGSPLIGMQAKGGIQQSENRIKFDKRSNSRKKEQSSGKKPQAQTAIPKDLLDSLASLRMNSTSLKAVLSNEVFRLRQTCANETRLIQELFDGLVELLGEQKDGIISRLNNQSSGLVSDIQTSMKKVKLEVLTEDRKEPQTDGPHLRVATCRPKVQKRRHREAARSHIKH